jgi:hypothetical protein
MERCNFNDVGVPAAWIPSCEPSSIAGARPLVEEESREIAGGNTAQIRQFIVAGLSIGSMRSELPPIAPGAGGHISGASGW